jgi:hypothetical protein
MPLFHTLTRGVTVALASVVAALVLVPPAMAASAPTAATEGPLLQWSRTGAPTPAPGGASFTTSTDATRNFVWQVNPTEHGATLAFDMQRTGSPAQVFASFPDNGVTLDERRQGVFLRMPGRVVPFSTTPLTAKTWHHVQLKLDIAGGKVTATIDGRSVEMLATLHYERVAQVGDLRAEVGGPYAFRNLRVALAPAPPSNATPSATGLFASDSVWNAPLPDDAPMDPASPELIAALNKEVDHERSDSVGGPWLSTATCAAKIYTVPEGQPKVPVALDNPTAPWRRTLANAFREGVPIPANATPATCQDAEMVILQPSTDSAWELFHMRKEGDGWHAGWGGAMRNVSTNPGYYTPDAFPGATYGWGATATSFPLFAGVIRADELKSGVINHALAMNLPEVRAGVQAWPAQRNDGTLLALDSLPEGAHLRLPASLNLDALGLPPATLAMARAAQRYGIVIRDVTHKLIKIDAQHWEPLGYNPYPSILGTVSPLPVMRAFPWDRLQVLRMDLRKPTT